MSDPAAERDDVSGGPLSAESEIVRLREDFHGLALRVGASAEGLAEIRADLRALAAIAARLEAAYAETSAEVRRQSDVLQPIAEHVELMRRGLYGGVAVILLAFLGTVVAMVWPSSTVAGRPPAP